MVIKKFNMEDFKSDSEIFIESLFMFLVVDDELGFLEKIKIRKFKKKDLFFVISDDLGDEGEDEDEGFENSRLQGDDVKDSDEEEELERGKYVFRLIFMGFLLEKDWRKSIKERNYGNMKGLIVLGFFFNFQKSRKGRDFLKKFFK